MKSSMEGVTMPDVKVAAVTGPLGCGLGEIAPEVVLTLDDTQRYAERLPGLLVSVEKDAPTVCFDGRPALSMLNGAEAQTGLKAAGGNSISVFYGLEVSGFFGGDTSLFQNYASVIRALEQEGYPVGYHTKDSKTDALAAYLLEQRAAHANYSIDDVVLAVEKLDVEITATGCGASEGIKPINGTLSRNPQEHMDGRIETDDEVIARLEHTFAVASTLSNAPLDRAVFEQQIDRATQMDNAGRYNDWDTVKALLIADKILLARGEDDGVLARIQVLHNDGKGVHGHTENNVVGIKVPGVTLENKTVIGATGFKNFIVNGDEVGEQAGSTFDYPSAKLGVLLFQVGTKTHLTNGQQRAIILAS